MAFSSRNYVIWDAIPTTLAKVMADRIVSNNTVTSSSSSYSQVGHLPGTFLGLYFERVIFFSNLSWVSSVEF